MRDTPTYGHKPPTLCRKPPTLLFILFAIAAYVNLCCLWPGISHHSHERVPHLPTYAGGARLVHPGVSEQHVPPLRDLGKGLPLHIRNVHREEEGQGGDETRKEDSQQVLGC